MTQTAKAQEPSMEEILASIRRIIADDDASKPANKAPESAAPPIPLTTAPSRPPSAPPQKPATASPAAAPRPAAVSQAAADSQGEANATLAEFDALKAVPRPQPATDVLNLTEAVAAPTTSAPGPTPSFRTIDGTSNVVFGNKPAPASDPGLISNETVAAVDRAFNTLTHTVVRRNARTLEDLVREMLRPMLKSWLDDNLPGLVERIVRAEIERVSRG